MSRRAAHARAGSDRPSLYDEITARIISELEAGRVPWVQPWGTTAAKAQLAMPKNGATGRSYSGINVLILWGAVIEHGFPAQGWVTFRQALGLGGNVRKGERSTTVVYADRFIPDDEKTRGRETGDEAQSIPFLKCFTVFNLAQCEACLTISRSPSRFGVRMWLRLRSWRRVSRTVTVRCLKRSRDDLIELLETDRIGFLKFRIRLLVAWTSPLMMDTSPMNDLRRSARTRARVSAVFFHDGTSSLQRIE
jgi:N-terminal domain of anti-restriction factor ArdC